MQQETLILTPSHFEELVKKGYSLDMVFILNMIKDELDIESMCEDSAKIDVLVKTMHRKGLITDNYKISSEGQELLRFLSSPLETKMIKKKPVEDDFDKWWKAYPGTDTFTYKGKTFTGSRTLRARKDDCRLKINKILNEGEYTITDLISALQFEVLQKKERSVKDNANRMSYMQNSLTYLNQRTFEPFIELIKEGAKVAIEPVHPKGGETDI